MPSIDIHIAEMGDGAWPDLAEKHAKGLLIETEHLSVSGLPGGMASGKASIAFRFDLPDGRVVFAQSSLRAFLAVADALRARLGDGQ